MSRTATLPDPRRDIEAVDTDRLTSAETPSVCLYLMSTNRCNLLYKVEARHDTTAACSQQIG